MHPVVGDIILLQEMDIPFQALLCLLRIVVVEVEQFQLGVNAAQEQDVFEGQWLVFVFSSFVSRDIAFLSFEQRRAA